MNGRTNPRSFILAILAALLTTGIASRATADGERFCQPSGVSEGLCAKVGDLPAGASPVWMDLGLAIGYIDSTGQWAIPPRFRRAEAFSRGIARVQDADDKPYYYIDRTGQRLSDELVKRTQAGLVRMQKGKKWGFADPATGQMVVEAKYDDVRDFSEGLAAVRDYSTALTPNGPLYRWDWIDYTGRVVVSRHTPYWSAGPFSEGLAAVAEEVRTSGADGTVFRVGFIDRTNAFVIEPQFDQAGDFHNGRAAVCVDGRWGFIDRTGKIVISPEYAGAQAFSEGFAPVQLSSEQEKALGLPPAPVIDLGDPVGWWGYIDREGKMVVPPHYTGAGPFSDGVAHVENRNFEGMIDYRGDVVYDLTVVDWNVRVPAKEGGDAAPTE
jgi:hypothetical protein